MNNASFTPAPLPGSAIAQGSIAAIFGTDIGPARFKQSEFPLPTEFEGVSVSLTAGGVESKAYLLYVSSTQVGLVIPSTTRAGQVTARLTFEGKTSAPVTFEVVPVAPALFTLNSAGNGPVVATTPAYRPIDYGNTAIAGDTLSLWGTGFGPLPSGEADNGPALRFDPTRPVEVLVGGRSALVRYRGRAPDLAGVDQIVFDVPEGVRGCAVTLVVRAGTVYSNYTTLAVGTDRRVCSEPHGFSESEWQRGTLTGLRFGSITLNRSRSRSLTFNNAVVEQRVESGTAIFLRYDVSSLFRSRALDVLTFGNCVVIPFQGSGPTGDPIQGERLNAGAAVRMTAPNGTLRRIERGGNQAYSTIFSRVAVSGEFNPVPTFSLDPGFYQFTADGGLDIPPFSARLLLPGFPSTNLTMTSVQRTAPLTVTWQSGDPGNEFVTISGASGLNKPAVGAQFTCMERASAGRFTIPAEILSALPASEFVQSQPLGLLSITVAPLTNNTRFTAEGLTTGFAAYNFTDSQVVAFR